MKETFICEDGVWSIQDKPPGSDYPGMTYVLENGVWSVEEESLPIRACVGTHEYSYHIALTKNTNHGMTWAPQNSPTNADTFTFSCWYWMSPYDVNWAPPGGKPVKTTRQMPESDPDAGTYVYWTGAGPTFFANLGRNDTSTGTGMMVGVETCYDPAHISGAYPGRFIYGEQWSGQSFSHNEADHFYRGDADAPSGSVEFWDDFGQWNHFVLSVSNREPTMYINGDQLPRKVSHDWSSTPMTWNMAGERNVVGLLTCKGDGGYTQFPEQFYTCEFHNVDGLALEPDSFVDSMGEPSMFSGDYGNNGWYVPVLKDEPTKDLSGKGNDLNIDTSVSEVHPFSVLGEQPEIPYKPPTI